MTSILFLDVDGVLNHRACFLPSRRGSPLCPDAIARLQHVVKVTGCQVVLSSTWRKLDHHVESLREAGGFPNPHSEWRTREFRNIVTSVMPRHERPACRGDEIAEWLSRHETDRYAIVDDDSDMLPEQIPFFVQTTFETGLQDDHAEQLIAILGSRLLDVTLDPLD